MNEEIKTVEGEETAVDMSEMITVDALDAIIDNVDQSVSLDWFGRDLMIRRNLSMDEVHSFVDAVVNACFDADGNYQPEDGRFMYKYCEVAFYTNVDLPRDSDAAYGIIYELDLNDLVRQYADPRQLGDLNLAIKEKIQYRLDMNTDAIHAELKRIESLVNEFGEVLGSIDPSDIKQFVSIAADQGKLDEHKIVEALYDVKAERKGDDA